jgi:hypothetical protein
VAAPFRSFTATITSGESLSEELSTHLWVPVALRLPPNLKAGTRFLTFEAKLGDLWMPVHDDSGDEAAVAINQDVDLTETNGLLVGLDVKRNGLESIRWSDGSSAMPGITPTSASVSRSAVVVPLPVTKEES